MVQSSSNLLVQLFHAAVDAALPDGKFSHLPKPPVGRTIVLGAGKAAASMAAAFESAWPHSVEGLVVTPYGHGQSLQRIEVVEAAHPVPDERGQKAAERILALARSANADDLVVALISGGASALMSLPAPGITLDDKRTITSKMLAAGMPIQTMNLVRQSLSSIKGGRLAAAAAPAKIVTYIISDIPGDNPAMIGSGPTLSTAYPQNAEELLRRHGIAIEDHVLRALRANFAPPPNQAEAHMLSRPMDALRAAERQANIMGLHPVILGDAIEGEAREAGRVMAGIARSVAAYGQPWPTPVVLLSGGETTVTVRGNGNGGRNSEFLLALFEAGAGIPGLSALACDTDGIDGKGPHAGAWFDQSNYVHARHFGLSSSDHLDRNDSGNFFKQLGTLVETGPTRTNVNDFRAIIVGGPV